MGIFHVKFSHIVLICIYTMSFVLCIVVCDEYVRQHFMNKLNVS